MRSDRSLAGAPLTLKVSARARRLRLRLDPRTRTIQLTVPRRTSERRALAWAAGQSDWAEAALAATPSAIPLVSGAVLPLRGVPHRILWQAQLPRRPVAADGRIAVGGPAEMIEARLLRWLKAEALALLAAETRQFAAEAGVMPARIGVGDAVSRWGSCSASGAIRYSWRLLLAPDFVRRATVAHEVAHLVHLNHGRNFHALVERLLGADPKPARQWLRREGAALHRYGR